MKRKGSYGVDAPHVPALLTLGALPLVFGAVSNARAGHALPAASMGLGAAFMLFSSGTFLYTTLAGKLAVWDELLDGLKLRGDERVLDLGCGRGMVLLGAAARLQSGKAVGLDLWQKRDQSGNGEAATRANAEAEGVAERIELHTGDMRKLPFEAGAFDVVLSSLAIHNIPDAAGRAEAVREAARMLKPGGRLLLADFRFVGAYARELQAAGLRDVLVRDLGPRFWYGGPWAGTQVVSARKP